MSKTKVKQKSQNTKKSLEYYFSLNYPITIYPDQEDGGYTAEIRELPGCLTQGETLQEVEENIQDARQLWIETAYENDDDIPLPLTENSYSGKTVVRMPRSLHQKLVENAEQENISLNQYILYLLSEQNSLKQLSNLFNKPMSNRKIQGVKQGNSIVFGNELSSIPDETPITVEISEYLDINRQGNWKDVEKILDQWQNDPECAENEEELLNKIDNIPATTSEKNQGN
jgi:predicted RNase H-like HicB family nuclease